MIRNRSECRAGAPCEIRSLSEAIYCTVHHSDLTAAQIAERLGKRLGYLLEAANPDRDVTQFQAALLLPLIAITGRAVVLEYLAREAGYALTAMPKPGTAARTDIFEELAGAITELGDTATSIRTAMRDRVVSPDELAKIRENSFRTVSAVARVIAEAEWCATASACRIAEVPRKTGTR